MKKTILLLLFAASLLSCSGDDTSDKSLNGHWNMDTYAAYMPEIPQLEPGDVTWQIDPATETLTVQNNVEEEYPYLLRSGTYEINLEGELFTIYNLEEDFDAEYKYRFEDEKFRLLEAGLDAADGPQMVFSRVFHND